MAHDLLPGIHQQEAAGAICIFHASFFEACLSEQSCLLVPCQRSDRNRRAQQIAHGQHAAAVTDLRHHASRNVPQRQQLLIIIQRLQVHEHRPRSVGYVADMRPAMAELPHQPGIDGAKAQLAIFRA